MKTKTHLFLCLATLLILISFTSCSGLLAGKEAGSGKADEPGKGRIVIDLGGERASAPEITRYSLYLIPASENRTAYENLLMSSMILETSSEAMNNDSLPEGFINKSGTTLKDSYEVNTGCWLVVLNVSCTDHNQYMGYNTVTVKKDQASSVTLEMTDDSSILFYDYAQNFEDSLYFIATKDTYSETQGGNLNIEPDISDFLEAFLAAQNEDPNGEEYESLLAESLLVEEDTAFKLTNIHPANNSLYADVTKVSFKGAADSNFLSNACIKYVTSCGVQIEAGGTGYFLFTLDGATSEYVDYLMNELIVKLIEAEFGGELPEEELAALAQLAGAEPGPITAEIIIDDPSSIDSIEEWISAYND